MRSFMLVSDPSSPLPYIPRLTPAVASPGSGCRCGLPLSKVSLAQKKELVTSTITASMAFKTATEIFHWSVALVRVRPVLSTVVFN